MEGRSPPRLPRGLRSMVRLRLPPQTSSKILPVKYINYFYFAPGGANVRFTPINRPVIQPVRLTHSYNAGSACSFLHLSALSRFFKRKQSSERDKNA